MTRLGTSVFTDADCALEAAYYEIDPEKGSGQEVQIDGCEVYLTAKDYFDKKSAVISEKQDTITLSQSH